MQLLNVVYLTTEILVVINNIDPSFVNLDNKLRLYDFMIVLKS